MQENKETVPSTPNVSDTASSLDIESSLAKPVEGGFEAWLTVLGSFLIYYASLGLINSFGYFQTFYQDGFMEKTNSSRVALIGTFQLAMLNLLATPAGALCDSYGFKHLYITSGCGTCVALILLSLTPSGTFWRVFLFQGLLMGASIGVGAQPALVTAGLHFKYRRASAMGVVIAGGAVGGVCFPILFAQLVPVVGFSWALRIAALKVAVCYNIALSISRAKFTARKPMREVFRTLLDFRGFLDSRYSTLCLGGFCINMGIWVPNYYIQSYCRAIDPITSVQDYILPVINGTSVFGMIIGGLVGDSIGRLNTVYPVALTLSFLCIIWFMARTILLLLFFGILFGLLAGTYTAVLPSVVAQLLPDENMGARLGAFYSVICLSGLTGAPIGGALIHGSTREGYMGVIGYACATLVVGAVALFVSRLLHDRNLRAKW